MLVVARALARSYASAAGTTVMGLPATSLQVEAGSSIAIVGPSGCGKSTLLNILGLQETATSGELLMFGAVVRNLNLRQSAELRLLNIGFVFQNFCLLHGRSVRENIELPLIYSGVPSSERRRASDAWLARLRIADLASRYPKELSGGQQQRVAIARAMVGKPKLILADEPTGSLDQETGSVVLEALLTSCADKGAACVLVTHDPAVAARCRLTQRLG
jgi:putative ABC transport system ATP-binding protein